MSSILTKRILALIILFLFCLGGTMAWALIGNAYVRLLPRGRKITLKEFWIQVFIFYVFTLFIFFIISVMFFKKYS